MIYRSASSWFNKTRSHHLLVVLVHIFSLIFWRAEDIVVDTYFHGILESLKQQGVIDHVNQVEVHHDGGWGLVQQQVWRYTG